MPTNVLNKPLTCHSRKELLQLSHKSKPLFRHAALVTSYYSACYRLFLKIGIVPS